MKLYQEVCTNIRTSDDISFKLLGFVPILSGAGATILSWKGSTPYPLPVVVLASLVGATFTFGLFRWEMRNVQKCDYLICVASRIERCLQKPLEFDSLKYKVAQYQEWYRADRPKLFHKIPKLEPSDKVEPWYALGKTEAERIIYGASIAAWLVPIVMSIVHR